MNNTMAEILAYAETQQNFSKSDLSAHLKAKMTVDKSTLSWYLHKLVNDCRLSRIGRGRYVRNTKRVFIPTLADATVSLYGALHKQFPFAAFCVYEGNLLSQFQQHLSSNQITYVEAERDVAESAFNYLKSQGYNAYLRPNKDFIYRYIDLNDPAVFVKNMVSESPLQKVKDVPVPTLEKLLVDVQCDPDFFYLQGVESHHIMQHALDTYSIHKDRLLRYASRRNLKQSLMSDFETLDLK